MKKGIKITLIILALAIVAFIIFRIVRGKSDKEVTQELQNGVGVHVGGAVKQTFNSATVQKPKQVTYNDLPLGSFPLKQSAGANKLTWLLQSVLNALHNAKLTVDGVFGPATETALFNNYRVREVDKAVATRIYQALASKTVQSPNYAQLAEQYKGIMNIITT